MRVSHDANAQTLRSEEQSIRGYSDGSSCSRNLEVHEGVSSRHQPSGRIVDVDLNIQGSRGGVDRIRIAYQRSPEILPWEGVQGHIDLVSGLHRGGVDFRDWNVNAQHLNGGQMKDLFGSSGIGLD